ncbi:ABC transporter ATP-binding protein/permease [Paenibacillus alkaliterrae]|uniref:ABC transporter ATP-binding protein n=1 Tax=Paenibacillus alkaliterrae TaxID=320909 RepID=UPI001F21EBB4|nr:ABC transporter ATP-binding protein [Paenibacillus alkaliterrae]MCF2937399.1 ABC transporter ATP-binding protein/permease [Paenibacillus alkaliterrae]
MKSLLYFTKKLHAYAGKILYINLFGSILIGLLDGIGILLLAPLLSIIGIVDIPLNDFPGLRVLYALQELPKDRALLIILGIYIIMVSGQSFIGRNIGLREIRIHTGFINHIRLEIYRTLLQANWGFIMKKRKSDLINSLTGELGRVTNSTFVFLQLLASIVFTAIQIGLAMLISFKMTLFVLGCGLVIALLSKRFIRKSRDLGTVMTDLAQSYLAGITDHFNGMKDIKSNLLESSRYRWLVDWSNKIAYERYENSKVRSNSQLSYKLFSTLMIAGFIYGSVTLFQHQGMSLLLILVIFSRLWPRFTGIQSNMENIAGSISALKALMELQEECFKAQELQGANGIDGGAIMPLKLEQNLECQQVYFRYDQHQPDYTLEAVNVRIPANSMTAIVGQSGAGKSTLIDLLMGLMKPEAGKVLVDGKELANADLLSLRKSISYVPQDPFLFHGSIRDNLIMINPNASEEQMWEAMEFSSAAEFVQKLPRGLNTVIGDRGVRLSGGERQRLVLARAILRKPSILILDEATSALDTVNETKIQEAIEKLKGRMTVIVIAHRLTTIRNADQVIVLDKGKIVQTGQFGQLSEDKKGLFNTLLGNQLQVAL